MVPSCFLCPHDRPRMEEHRAMDITTGGSSRGAAGILGESAATGMAGEFHNVCRRPSIRTQKSFLRALLRMGVFISCDPTQPREIFICIGPNITPESTCRPQR